MNLICQFDSQSLGRMNGFLNRWLCINDCNPAAAPVPGIQFGSNP